MKDICPHCEKETELAVVRALQKINVQGEEIPVDVEYFRCETCNQEFDDPQSEQDPLEIAYREYRKRHGMLQPEAIKELRKKYGLTQYEMSGLLGWGIATLSRYENGALQDDAHEKILHLIADPRNFLKLVEENLKALPNEKRNRIIHELRQAVKEHDPIEQILEERFGNYASDEFCGYKRLDLGKLFQAALFFCQDGVSKTKLNKLLFYADFKHCKEYAVSITGVRYAHIPFGPAPDQYDHYFATLRSEHLIAAEEICCSHSGDVIGEKLITIKRPDLGLFSTSELKILASVKEHFSSFNAKDVTEFSHDEQGYKETVTGQLISYNYAKALKI